jgi:hypothetical protein
LGKYGSRSGKAQLTKTRLAVKLPLDAGLDKEAIKQEADLWVRGGNHPNVMPLFEANVYNGQAVIVSEYAPDGSLQKWLNAQPRPTCSADMVVHLITGILNGLGHLHAQGILHRDLKPANVLMQGGIPRLADFGLARLVDSTLSQVSGSPAYMAPEAFDGQRSVRSDLWSVGVILYQLLAGELPFQERESGALMRAIISREPKPLPHTVPEPLRKLVARALEKSPENRCVSATEMLTDLLKAQASLAAPALRLTAHLAAFVGTSRYAIFIKATNLSPTYEAEITHVWLECEGRLHVMNDKRPLPKRLKPFEVWETWIEALELPPVLVTERVYELARVRLSTGEIISSVHDREVPMKGYVAGSTSPLANEETVDQQATTRREAPPANPEVAQDAGGGCGSEHCQGQGTIDGPGGPVRKPAR